jgi:hypothetical protein
VLQRPDLSLSPSAEGERLDPPSTQETSSAPARSPLGDTAQGPSPDARFGEEMVLDARAALTPAQVVERQVIARLKGGALPIRGAVAEFHSGHVRRRRVG